MHVHFGIGVFLKEFRSIFSPQLTPCFSVLGLTKHLSVYALNSPCTLHLGRVAGRAPCLQTSGFGYKDRHGIKCELNAVPATCQQQRWLWKLANSQTLRADLSPLSFLFSRCNFLTRFRQKSEARDKHFNFVRETKMWGIAFCPDLLKQRRESAAYPVQ